MKIDKEGTLFTFGFATVMVIVVGTLLALAAMGLKPFQLENIRQEKMKYILMSIGAMERSDNMKDAPALFEQFVKEQKVIDYKTNELDGVVAFEVNIKKEFKSLDVEERKYPIYLCEKDGKRFYVVPMVGTGLWGPVWGFIALNDDLNTIAGAVFDHKSETPGLGAEINQPGFQEPFIGKKIFDENGNFVSIKILKGGADPADMHGVDGITGGTITSVAVGKMIDRTLNVYVPYFEKMKNAQQ